MRNDEDNRWKVGELAGVTGLTVRALHHYDDVGLLVPSQRTSGGHRVYDARDVERLYRVLALRRLGLRLDEIASLLDDGGVSLLETVRRHLEQVERELAHQHRLRERLRQILAVLHRSAEPPVEDYLDAVEAMTMIEIDVQDVVMRVPGDDAPVSRSPREGNRVVLLREHDGERILPIWIGAHEGDALVFGRSGGKFPRPLGPDLTASLLRAGGVRVERVVIESLRENTYFATVIIASGGEMQEVDARPSDALNLAARLGVPVYAAPEVMDHAGIVSDEELSSRLRAGERREAGTPGGWRSVTPDLLRSLWVDADPESPLTEQGRQVLSWAREEARALSHEHIEPEHILLGLLHDPDNPAGRVLESLGITMALARPRVQRIEGSSRELTDDEIALSPQAKKVVFLAVSVAVSLGPNDAGPEHILLAQARQNALLELGVHAERDREEDDRVLRALLSSEPSAGTGPPDPT